jgi:hypothetical protein
MMCTRAKPPQKRVRDESPSLAAGLSGPEMEIILAPMPNVWASALPAAPAIAASAAPVSHTARHLEIPKGNSFRGHTPPVLTIIGRNADRLQEQGLGIRDKGQGTQEAASASPQGGPGPVCRRLELAVSQMAAGPRRLI